MGAYRVRFLVDTTGMNMSLEDDMPAGQGDGLIRYNLCTKLTPYDY